MDAMDKSAAAPLESEKFLIEVAVALPVFSTYTYRVPEALSHRIVEGIRVLAPFGRRKVTGYVVGTPAQAPDVKLKTILDVLDEEPLFPASMLSFFNWIADYYMHPIGEVLQSALPAGINIIERKNYALTDTGKEMLSAAGLDDDSRKILHHLAHNGATLASIRQAVGHFITAEKLASLEKRYWIQSSRELTGGRTRPKIARYVRCDPSFHEASGRLSDVRRKILQELKVHGPMFVADLKTKIPTAGNMIGAMAKDGQVLIEARQVYRDPLGEPIVPDTPPKLTQEQAAAIEVLGAALGKGYQAFLLAGVTGSGKTEIYLRMAAMALDRGVSVLVLVPEIGLITQTERSFRARFGECVALLHSGLSHGERFDQWQRVRRGEAAIAIGARSAIFAPFADIGLIIIDEEHDDSYKQEGALRYNARDMAVVRAKQFGALIILGSATPSMQSAYNAQNGKFARINLHERVDQQPMPEISIQDLTAVREERGVRRYLTSELVAAMTTVLNRNEQVLIFLNRRGFSNALVCATCGKAQRCDHCDISLTYHQHGNAYRCHYCGYQRAAVARCRQCSSGNIHHLGIGTEKMELEMQKLFPAARIARMDRDTTRRKGSLAKILKDLRHRKIDILIGTQMVAKGHDYPHITLVGIICADLSLNLPDFRAGERTFQLLAQVAGRAGRGDVPGRVILQTYNPDHFSILAAREQDFDAFYRQEIEFRKALGYPPVTRMVQIRISGRSKDMVAACAEKMGAHARNLAAGDANYRSIRLLGPIEAPLARIADHYRWQMLVIGDRVGALHRLVHATVHGSGGVAGKKDIAVALDVDPVFLM